MSERTLKWFGLPWPSPERRAPVCEDDADRIDVPIGQACARCTQIFFVFDRGVALPGFNVVPGDPPRMEFPWFYYHARCFLAEVVGDRMALEITTWMDSA